MPHALVLPAPTTEDSARRAGCDALTAWRAGEGDAIEWCYPVLGPVQPPGVRRALLVSAPRASLARLPPGATWHELDPLLPSQSVAAYVRDVAHDARGQVERGLRHFAPGTLVYVAPPYSGDGGERTFLVGRDRESGRYIAVMGPTAKLKRWHTAWITHPAALFAVRNVPGAWWGRDGTTDVAHASRPDAPPPVAWESEAAWSALVAGCLAPERPGLARCAAAVLGCALTDAEAWLADGSLGARLTEAEKGRYLRGAGDAVVRSGHAAWELLAPPAWLDAGAPRVFVRPDLARGAAPDAPWPARARPGHMTEAVAFCAAPEGVATAEALGRAIAVALPGANRSSPPGTTAWRFASRNVLLGDPVDARHGAAAAPPRVDTHERALAALRALARAVAGDADDEARVLVDAFRAFARASGGADPSAPALDLLARGYVLLGATADEVRLGCPELPRGPLAASVPRGVR